MPELTGGQALVEALKLHGVDTIFGLPGIQLDWAFDALWAERESIKVIHARHEQATVGMADGYARSTGKIGVALVVPGPGVLNTTAALSTAYACNSPVLLLTGQVQSDLIDAGRGLLHEIHDQLGLLRHLTKWSERSMKPEEIPGHVAAAFRELQSGRVRPVSLEIPPDVLAAKADVRLPEPYIPNAREPESETMEQAARALGQAKNPVIFVGGGVISAEASDELLQLAEMLQAPVYASSNGRGALSDHHYLSQFQISAPDLVAEADVILVAGTRFLQGLTASWGPKDGQTVIRLDIDEDEITRIKKPDIALIGDAKAGLAGLVARTSRHNAARPSRKEEMEDIRTRSRQAYDAVGLQADYANAIRAEAPDDAIIVGEMTQVAYWSNLAFPVYRPRSYITPGYQGTLGFGFATALGAKVGNPDRVVISVNGDGGFGYQLQELSTMARHGIGAIAIVFSDNAYGNVRRIQKLQFNGHTIASDLHNPDWVKLAEAFGVNAARATTPDELRLQLRNAMGRADGTLIEVPMPEVPQMLGLRLPAKA